MGKHKTKLLFSILLFVCFSNTVFAGMVEKKNILLLHSYHHGMTWVENINKAVNDMLLPDENDYVIYTEYMDTKRHNSDDYHNTLKELYLKKYKDIKFDIILSSDNNAFNFLLKYRDKIFGNVPVSFCGVNAFEKEMLQGHKNFTGVAEYFSDKETIETILKLHPSTKNIYIINDYLQTGLAWKKDMKKNLKHYEDKVNIIYSENLNIKDLKKKIDSLEEDTVVLLGVYFADKEKNYVTYERVGKYLLQGSKTPVYCLLNFNISGNIIGGKVIGGYSQGKAMSEIANRVLDGEPTDKINITFSEANEYIFNYDGLKRYNIEENLLPKNSKIINKPFSLYEEYKTMLLNLLLTFIFLLTISISILAYLKYKNKSKSANIDRLIISYIRFSPVFIIPIITALAIWLFVYSTNKNNNELKEIEIKSYINTKKMISQREVDRYIDIVKLRLDKYNKNNPDELSEIKKNTLYIAQNIKYGKSGYLMVGSLKGIMLAHPNENLVGANLFDGKHDKAKDVFLKFKEKIKKDGKGFVMYNWINPNTNVEEQKYTYVNYIKELNWYVASGVYLDEIDNFINNKIKNNTAFSEKNIKIIILFSITLMIFSFVISVILSMVIKNIFEQYKKSIISEVKKVKEVEKSEKIFKQMANTDALTKIHNRLSIMNILQSELIESISTKKSLSIIMLDIDHFKIINDTYGHSVGDKVLIDITKNIKSNLRDKDNIGRYGGEEFIICLPDTNLDVAKKVAERLCKSIESYDYTEIDRVTVSMGVVEVKEDESLERALKRVDLLLYKSKENGRNMVSYE
jgi:diguanylate cyclase (GGDEF)-like protein